VLGTIQHVRNTSNLSEMLRQGVALIGSHPELLLSSNIGEFSAPSGSLLILIDGIQRGFTNYSWGYTYLTEMAVLIPRPFLPGRPLPLPELFMNTFFPELYLTGHGFGFFMPMEGYWAFGITGVFFDLAVFGALLAAVFRFFRSNRDRPSAFLFYVFIFPVLAIGSARGGMLGALKSSVLTSAPLIFLMFLSRVRRVKVLPRDRSFTCV